VTLSREWTSGGRAAPAFSPSGFGVAHLLRRCGRAWDGSKRIFMHLFWWYAAHRLAFALNMVKRFKHDSGCLLFLAFWRRIRAGSGWREQVVS